jgi:hypothetical protein
MRASQGWRKLTITFDDQVKLMELRHKLGHKAKKEQRVYKNQRVSHENFSSKNKT